MTYPHAGVIQLSVLMNQAALQPSSSSAASQPLKLGPFGVPQIVAGVLLLAFIAQCAYFIAHVPLTQVEMNYVLQGVAATEKLNGGIDQYRSPLVPLIAVAGVAPSLYGQQALAVNQFWLDQHRWQIRIPFLLAGVFLAASLWFVARRLFGNEAGYLALGMYCFSPGFIARSSMAGPEVIGAWGAFGVIFTAIATAHTLYAPREVVLWNWKRILILGISIALAVGAQWSLIVVLVPAVAFMLWAVPHRRGAALVIFFAAALIALVLLDAFYLGNPVSLWRGAMAGHWFSASVQNFARGSMYGVVGGYFMNAIPAASLLFLVSIIAFAAWKRVRFFGTVAPLVVSALMLLCGFLLEHAGGALFFFYALPFILLFSAGVFVDLFESERPSVPVGVAYGSMLAQVVYSVAGLMRVFSRG